MPGDLSVPSKDRTMNGAALGGAFQQICYLYVSANQNDSSITESYLPHTATFRFHFALGISIISVRTVSSARSNIRRDRSSGYFTSPGLDSVGQFIVWRFTINYSLKERLPSLPDGFHIAGRDALLHYRSLSLTLSSIQGVLTCSG
jgi:hypothetical protein